jgi:hypothetical protein
MQARSLALIITFVGLSMGGPASAQYSMQDDSSPSFEWSGTLDTDFQKEFKTETDGGDRFESWRLGIAGEFGGPINESILIGFGAGYHHSSYEFHLDNAPGVPSIYGSSELPKSPWGAINTIDLAPSTTILVGDHFAVVAAVPIRWSGETGSRRNGFVAGISAIGRWQLNDQFRIGVGIGVTSQLEDDAETFPLISLDWEISESMQLKTEGSWTQGGNAMLLWGPNDSIRVTFSAGYERNRFRLDDNGFAADKNGIGEVTAVPLEIGLRLGLFEGAFFDFRLGLAVAGRLRIENDNGNKIYEEDYDPAPRVGIGLTLPLSLPQGAAGS